MPDHASHAAAFNHAFWFDIVPRSVACPGLPPQVLLHAGPPYRGSLPAAVLNAAVQAVLYEGLATDEDAARAMIASGAVRLEPAQDHCVATPLAQVVSASMPLLAVRQSGETFYAPVVEGPAPALRFGASDACCRDALSAFGAWLMDTVAPLVRRRPVAIDRVVRAALALGDECHARTGAANEALLSRIDGLDAEGIARLRANPAFVLTMIMAGAGAALRSHKSGIAAIGGNGIDFGVRHRGETQWRRTAAEAPRGTRFPAHGETAALPAIGDSAVIDFCGLGGQALDAAPLLAAEWAHLLPEDAQARRTALLDAASGIVDPARVVQSRMSPLINLAILDSAGTAGLIGRGFYAAPASLFYPLAASANSLIGFRSTKGLVSRAGVMPVSETQDVVGPLTRTVADAAAMLDVIAGYDALDAASARGVGKTPKSFKTYLDPKGLAGARIGVLKSFAGTKPEHEEVNAAMANAVSAFKKAGATVVEIDDPFFDTGAINNNYDVQEWEFKTQFNDYLKAYGSNAPVRDLSSVLASGKYHKPSLEKFLTASDALETPGQDKDYLARLSKIDSLRDRLLGRMAEHRVDVIVYPLQKRLVVPVGELNQADRNGILAAMTGFPAVTVPIGFSKPAPDAPVGVPIGMDIMGRPFDDGLLIKTAYAFEQATKVRKAPQTTPALK